MRIKSRFYLISVIILLVFNICSCNFSGTKQQDEDNESVEIIDLDITDSVSNNGEDIASDVDGISDVINIDNGVDPDEVQAGDSHTKISGAEPHDESVSLNAVEQEDSLISERGESVVIIVDDNNDSTANAPIIIDDNSGEDNTSVADKNDNATISDKTDASDVTLGEDGSIELPFVPAK